MGEEEGTADDPMTNPNISTPASANATLLAVMPLSHGVGGELAVRDLERGND